MAKLGRQSSGTEELIHAQFFYHTNLFQVHLISPNVYRSYSEARETFEWFSETGQWASYFPGN